MRAGWRRCEHNGQQEVQLLSSRHLAISHAFHGWPVSPPLTAGESVGSPRPRYRWAVTVYDRTYRFLHRLDSAEAEVGPAVRIEVRRSHRILRLGDGTSIRRGDRIGVLHLNNALMAALHSDGRPPIAVGLEFRRQLLSSLHELARLAGPGGRLTDVKAFSATTIFFHQGLTRLGFTAENRAPACPRLVAAYQRALLVSLHPAGGVRLRRSSHRRALRLWISRENLLARYGSMGSPSARPAVRTLSSRLSRARSVTHALATRALERWRASRVRMASPPARAPAACRRRMMTACHAGPPSLSSAHHCGPRRP
jgi:hypothetical protein